MYMFVPLLGIRDGHVRQLTTLKSLGTRCGLWTGGATKLRPSLLAAQDEKEVRRFLGLAVYYRRFITGSAEFPSPLTDLTYLTWKGASDPIQWSEQCLRAFKEGWSWRNEESETKKRELWVHLVWVPKEAAGGPPLHGAGFIYPNDNNQT
ncbi:uncharacterized protein AB9W97_001488 isoform 2-T2 [Spinachia spinachia]